MFITLLIVTFATAALVSLITVSFFKPHIKKILLRIISDEISSAWSKYMTFAIYVVGISGGVRIRSLEQYVNQRWKEQQLVELNVDRWILEVYRTVIGSLQSMAWMLLVFFVVALVAYMITRLGEWKRKEAVEGSTKEIA